ncbi:lamin tail domain-containing protein [Candidatus Woesearchaeota archaeon]|nr:lamin tail domain-containing protein [Candidatus Woesearchaeota archaeon]
MKKIIVLILLICINSAFAIEINQVLIDPKDESGGEAVELWNPSNAPINISGWYLSTESSEKDAILPENTFIKPNDYFLITDTNWSNSKDNPSWRNADYEQSITLKNENSWVELTNNLGEIIEKASWTKEAGLIKMNNSFINATPQFFDKNTIPLEIIVEKKTDQQFYMLDESNNTGIQINPIAEETKQVPIRIKSEKQPKLEFLEEIFFMNNEKNGYYNSTLELPYYLPANNYSIKIENETINFEYLRLEDYKVITKQLIVKNNGVLELKNTGNVPLNLTLKIELPVNATLKHNILQLNVGEETKFNLEFNIPENIQAGKYQGVLKIE